MLLQVFIILFSSFAGVGTAAQNLAPRPPVAAPAPRAVPPYKYASSVRSPHPAVQPLQVTQGSGLWSPCSYCSPTGFTYNWSVFTETSSYFYNPDRHHNLEFKNLAAVPLPGATWLVYLSCTCKPFFTHICCKDLFLGSLLARFATIHSLTSLPYPH